MMKRPCCQHQLCRSCFTTYLSCKVTMGVTRIPCPLYPCSGYVKDHEVFANLISGQHKQLYHKLLVDKANDPTLKTCPRCGQDFQVQVEALQGFGVARNGLAVTCQACDLRWCFTCHAPLHEGVTCRERRQGDQEFQAWVQRRDANNNANAQKCPGCGVGQDLPERPVCFCRICADCPCLFLPLPAWPFACLPFARSVSLFLSLSFCLPVSQNISLPTYLSFYLSIFLPTYLSFYLMCLSVFLCA